MDEYDDHFHFDQDVAPAPIRERYPPIDITEASHYRFLHAIGCCAITGETGAAIEIEHLRDHCFAMGKSDAGMARKPDYRWTIPIKADLHHERHRIGAAVFWRSHRWPVEDVQSGPLVVALALVGFSARDDAEAARRWLIECALMRKGSA